MNHFIDPENIDEIIEKFQPHKTDDEIYSLIDQYLPDWLIQSFESYSSDYPHLQSNWNRVCDMLKVSPKKIVLVKELHFEDNHHVLLNFVGEFMTKRGYMVRREGEFTNCLKCNKAIPVVEVWHLLKEKQMPVPLRWSHTCRECQI